MISNVTIEVVESSPELKQLATSLLKQLRDAPETAMLIAHVTAAGHDAGLLMRELAIQTGDDWHSTTRVDVGYRRLVMNFKALRIL